MKNTYGFWICFLMFQWAVFSQQAPKEVLFTIDQKPYYTDEFLRVYYKNLDLVKDETQKDPDHYLELFLGYKLKIAKAYALGLHENQSYQNELKSYRGQLAKNYLTDSKVTRELVEEAYERMQKEVKASHILILVDEGAAPQDTLNAYKKIIALRDRIIKGEDFGAVVQAHSEDPSAKENKGSLGFFSAFRMVYAFESAAFNTPVGTVSQPIRTRFGYHLIKVEEVRPNRGDITVAHIMILNDPNGDETVNAQSKKTIEEIHQKLMQGERFDELARQFSQDKSSASRGGQLNRFSSGQLSSEAFENVAFGLEKPGDISTPFESAFGWHIVTLIEKHPAKSFEELQQEIEQKIGRDERSRLIAASMNEKLRAKYKAKRNDKMYQNIVKTLNDSYYSGEWNMPEQLDPFRGTLLTLHDRTYTGTDFLSYLYNQQRNGELPKPIQKLAERRYREFADAKLNEIYNDNLENEFPEFAAVMEEYRDGLLLFELMEKEIWEKSKTDTLGLQQFHAKNINRYQWNDRIEGFVASTTRQDMAQKTLDMIKKGKSMDEIKEVLNSKESLNVMTVKGTFEQGHDALPKSYALKNGVSEIIREGDYFYIVKANEFLPAGPKAFEECRGRVINDYQQFLEENWVNELKNSFKVEVDRTVFERMKAKMKRS
ncbi:MAG: peptidylprolyl isomerase [Flavobacterium sp.]